MTDVLDALYGTVASYVDLLKDSTVSEALFSGSVTVWQVLIGLFCSLILLRFFLSPVPGNGVFGALRSSSRPQHIDKDGGSNG